MAREKATLTLDRGKAEVARSLIGARSVSETVDVALERLIRGERLRRDVALYRSEPPDDLEIALGDLPVELDLEDDAVDYEALYGKRR